VSAVVTRRTTWAQRNKRLAECLREGKAVPHELREWHITTSFMDALKRHTPTLYSGPVTLFRAREIANVYSHIGERLGWDESLIPNLTIHEVPGGHDSLVREPNVRVLASGLEDVLRAGSVESPCLSDQNRKVSVGA
jgi:thioesterase domain-containing protein